MRQQYKDFEFRKDTLKQIEVMNEVIREYMRQGFRLTVRQLYYQMVARGYIENTERSYKRTTSIVNDARLAGLMDWEAIEDRTREFISRSRWESGAQILRSASDSYHQDMWATQEYRLFCIVEKEALAGVLERVCHKYDIPLLAARGYPSGTVLREFVLDDLLPCADSHRIKIVHLGDHDPSGIDMTRDLEERIQLFCGREASFELERVALNMPQIEERRPPPNPAKSTDSRFQDYQRKFGSESWELDALQPQYLASLVEEQALAVIDPDKWARTEAEIEDVKLRITVVSADFE